MAGLVKPKKLDWQDTNLALFGSDTEKNVSVSFKMAAVSQRHKYRVVNFQTPNNELCQFVSITMLSVL